MHLDTLTGIDLTGERNSVIIKPGSRLWSATTLPWMAFGYNIEITPLQMLTLYNAVANNGTMVRPYLVNAIKEEGTFIKSFQPKVTDEKICSDATLKQVQECLKGVCVEGTAKELFKNSAYSAAGKTGTALVANGTRGYADRIYQSSFAGYFPADNPQYTCIVVIRNKPGAKVFYGAVVAGVVFKEIADRLYTTYVRQSNYAVHTDKKADSSFFNYVGFKEDVKQVMDDLKMNYKDSTSATEDWADVNANKGRVALINRREGANKMPLLKGMGLKDVVYLCENMGLKVAVKGKGKVTEQSIAAGQTIARGQIISVELN